MEQLTLHFSAGLREPHRTWGGGDIRLKRQFALDPGQKQWCGGSLGQTYLLVLESLLRRWGDCGSRWKHRH